MSLLFRRSNGFYYLVTYHNGHRTWRSTVDDAAKSGIKLGKDVHFRLAEIGYVLIPSEYCPEFRGKLPTGLVRFYDIFHAEAFAIDKERIAVMQQAVEDSGRDDIVVEDFSPLLEGLV